MIAAIAAVVAGVIVALLSNAGVIRGLPGVMIVVIIWIFLPSAPNLSRRLALNGAIALGTIPVLWWVKWPTVFGASHSGLILATLSGFLVFRFASSRQRRRSLVPTLSSADLIPVAGALFSTWFFLPLTKARSGAESVAMLINGWGNDNVAHFEMFSMIRRNLVTGLGWGEPVGGSSFAYVNYPQHFHVLVAFVAELVHGPSVGSVGTEVGLYGLGTALVLSGAIITLLAAIASCRPLLGQPAIALVAGGGAVSFVLLGMGSDALSFGFPGFLIAIIGTLIGCVIGLGVVTTSRSTLLASAAMLILVTHTWSLLAPLAFVPFLFATVRYPWIAQSRRPRALIVPCLIVMFAVAGVGYGGILVYLATYSVGSVASVLTIGGAFPPVSMVLAAVITVTSIGIAVGWASRLQRARLRWTARQEDLLIDKYTVALIATVVIVGSIGAIGLVDLQFLQSSSLSYYQLKFIYGLTIVFAVLLIVLAGAWVARVWQARRPSFRRFVEVLSIGLLVAAVPGSLLLSFVAAPVSATPHGVLFRTALETSATSSPAMASRILSAARIMQSLPCTRPIYVALLPDDPMSDQSNQWAMSFSGTWTESAQPVNALLAETPREVARVDPSTLVEKILSGDPDRCVIVAPQVKQQIDRSVTEKFGGRILTLGK